MSQDPELTLARAGAFRAATQGTAEPPFGPAECGFCLPALAVHPAMACSAWLLPEALDHLSAILGLGPLAPLASSVERKDRAAHPQLLAAESVILFAVEGGIPQDPVPTHDQRGLLEGRGKLRGVVAGAGGDGGR